MQARPPASLLSTAGKSTSLCHQTLSSIHFSFLPVSIETELDLSPFEYSLPPSQDAVRTDTGFQVANLNMQMTAWSNNHATAAAKKEVVDLFP